MICIKLRAWYMTKLMNVDGRILNTSSLSFSLLFLQGGELGAGFCMCIYVYIQIKASFCGGFQCKILIHRLFEF